MTRNVPHISLQRGVVRTTIDARIPRHDGFSLIEAVVTMGVFALLLGIAVPAYQGYVMRTHRMAAVERLLDALRCQERIYSSEYHYDTTRCAETDPAGNYRLQFEPADASGTIAFTVAAIPQGRQTDDPCGTLTIDHAGNRAISGAADALRRCWEGR